MTNYKDLAESELLDCLCFFCDIVEHASHSDASFINDLAIKFMEIGQAFSDNEDIMQTVIYGMGVFGYYLTKEQFASYLSPTVALIKNFIN